MLFYDTRLEMESLMKFDFLEFTYFFHLKIQQIIYESFKFTKSFLSYVHFI